MVLAGEGVREDRRGGRNRWCGRDWWRGKEVIGLLGEGAREDAKDEATIASARESAVNWGTMREVV